MTHPASGNPTWQDWPATSTPINALSLERVESALDGLGARMDALDGGGLPRPFFRIDLTTGYTNNANTDTLAQSGWTIRDDTHGTGFASPSAGTNCTYTIPLANRRWDVMFTVTTSTQSLNAAFAAKVLHNGTSVTGNSMTADYCELLGGEGYLRAWKMSVPLVQGDVLRWATWSSVAAAITISRFGQQTQLIVRDAGPV